MKKVSALVLAAAVLPFIGCNNSSSTGSGPTGGSHDTFLISTTNGQKVMTPSLKQGEVHTETIKIERGSDFKSDLKFSAEDVPTGLKVEFDPVTVKGGDKPETTVKITAADDAPLNEAKFKVVATPPKGTAEPLEVKVKITEKKK